MLAELEKFGGWKLEGKIWIGIGGHGVCALRVCSACVLGVCARPFLEGNGKIGFNGLGDEIHPESRQISRKP